MVSVIWNFFFGIHSLYLIATRVTLMVAFALLLQNLRRRQGLMNRTLSLYKYRLSSEETQTLLAVIKFVWASCNLRRFLALARTPWATLWNFLQHWIQFGVSVLHLPDLAAFGPGARWRTDPGDNSLDGEKFGSSQSTRAWRIISSIDMSSESSLSVVQHDKELSNVIDMYSRAILFQNKITINWYFNPKAYYLTHITGGNNFQFQ